MYSIVKLENKFGGSIAKKWLMGEQIPEAYITSFGKSSYKFPNILKAWKNKWNNICTCVQTAMHSYSINL